MAERSGDTALTSRGARHGAEAEPQRLPLGFRPPPGGSQSAAADKFVILAGNETDPYEGTWYAVYAFLEDLGCRWYMPDDFGEVVPKRATLEIPEGRRTVRPAFRLRYLWYSGAAKAPENGQALLNTWKRRVGMNQRHYWFNAALPEAKWLQSPVDGTTDRLLPKERYWESHPEYYALNPDGSRNGGFVCGSNPAGIAAAADTINRFFTENPDCLFYGFAPPDSPVLCHCEGCKAAMNDGFGGEGYGAVSDPYYDFTFQVADKVADVHPDGDLDARNGVSHVAVAFLPLAIRDAEGVEYVRRDRGLESQPCDANSLTNVPYVVHTWLTVYLNQAKL